MKRVWIWLSAVAAALALQSLLPFEHTDVAGLVPVEALIVSVENGQIRLKGADCTGTGKTWDEAVTDLHRSAKGTLFLGTAEHVILMGEAESLVLQVAQSEILRPAAEVCRGEGQLPAAKDIAAYLAAHNSGVTLQHVQAAALRGNVPALPVLKQTEGGLRLYGTQNR